MDQEKTPLEIMQGFDPWGTGDGEAHSISDFPPEVQADVEGLMWLGHLEEQYDFCGHQFVLRTLKGGEELQASLVCKEFNETLGQARAWAWATLSQSLEAIDGDREWCPPLTHNELQNARGRFNYLIKKWYWPTAAHLYARYNELVERQAVAVQAMEDLSRGSLHTFSPFAGSSGPQGNSEAEPPPSEDIRSFLDEEDTTDSNSDS